MARVAAWALLCSAALLLIYRSAGYNVDSHENGRYRPDLPTSKPANGLELALLQMKDNAVSKSQVDTQRREQHLFARGVGWKRPNKHVIEVGPELQHDRTLEAIPSYNHKDCHKDVTHQGRGYKCESTGLQLCVFPRRTLVTGKQSPYFCKHYDTYHSPREADDLAEKLWSLHEVYKADHYHWHGYYNQAHWSSSFVVIVSVGRWERYVTYKLVKALKWCGSKSLWPYMYSRRGTGHPLAFVGVPGIGYGNGVTKIRYTRYEYVSVDIDLPWHRRDCQYDILHDGHYMVIDRWKEIERAREHKKGCPLEGPIWTASLDGQFLRYYTWPTHLWADVASANNNQPMFGNHALYVIQRTGAIRLTVDTNMVYGTGEFHIRFYWKLEAIGPIVAKVRFMDHHRMTVEITKEAAAMGWKMETIGNTQYLMPPRQVMSTQNHYYHGPAWTASLDGVAYKYRAWPSDHMVHGNGTFGLSYLPVHQRTGRMYVTHPGGRGRYAVRIYHRMKQIGPVVAHMGETIESFSLTAEAKAMGWHAHMVGAHTDHAYWDLRAPIGTLLNVVHRWYTGEIYSASMYGVFWDFEAWPSNLKKNIEGRKGHLDLAVDQRSGEFHLNLHNGYGQYSTQFYRRLVQVFPTVATNGPSMEGLHLTPEARALKWTLDRENILARPGVAVMKMYHCKYLQIQTPLSWCPEPAEPEDDCSKCHKHPDHAIHPRVPAPPPEQAVKVYPIRSVTLPPVKLPMCGQQSKWDCGGYNVCPEKFSRCKLWPPERAGSQVLIKKDIVVLDHTKSHQADICGKNSGWDCSGVNQCPEEFVRCKVNPPFRLCDKHCMNNAYLDRLICQCVCSGNWVGAECGECELRCKNGGELDKDNCRCKCPPPWVGNTCTDLGKCRRMCQNGGTLDMDTCQCKCPEGLKGESCEKHSWCYEDMSCEPKVWSKLSQGYAMCGAGRHQSPINIETAKILPLEHLTAIGFNYSTNATMDVHFGSVLSTRFARGGRDYGGASFLDEKWRLEGLEMHWPSEHLFGGHAASAEVHFIHRLVDDAANFTSASRLTISALYVASKNAESNHTGMQEFLTIAKEYAADPHTVRNMSQFDPLSLLDGYFAEAPDNSTKGNLTEVDESSKCILSCASSGFQDVGLVKKCLQACAAKGAIDSLETDWEVLVNSVVNAEVVPIPEDDVGFDKCYLGCVLRQVIHGEVKRRKDKVEQAHLLSWYQPSNATHQNATAHNATAAPPADADSAGNDTDPMADVDLGLCITLCTPVPPPERDLSVRQSTDKFFYYDGSLFTPPCTENSHTVVLERPLTIHADQLKELKSLIPEKKTQRPAQDLNSRNVFAHKNHPIHKRNAKIFSLGSHRSPVDIPDEYYGKQVRSPQQVFDPLTPDDNQMVRMSASAATTIVRNYRSTHTKPPMMRSPGQVYVRVPKGSTMMFNEEAFDLTHLIMYTPARHKIDGKAFAAELNMVHQNKNGAAIFAVLLDAEGAANVATLDPSKTTVQNSGHNTFIQSFISGFPDGIDASEAMSSHPNYYMYDGSLLVPPFTEGVRWIVVKDTLRISQEQAEVLKKLIPPRQGISPSEKARIELEEKLSGGDVPMMSEEAPLDRRILVSVDGTSGVDPDFIRRNQLSPAEECRLNWRPCMKKCVHKHKKTEKHCHKQCQSGCDNL